MENIEQKIIEYIKETYHPLAILLHGSRANGNARAHSDWDFAIFVKEKIVTKREVLFSVANIEIKQIIYPVLDTDISNIGHQLRKSNVRVVYDPEHICDAVIEQVTTYFEQGRPPEDYDENETIGHAAWMRSQIDGMIDYQHEPLAFFRKSGELYIRVIQYWFRFLKHDWMPQVYEALPRIQKEDPEYYALMEAYVQSHSAQEQILISEKIYVHLFGNK